MVTNRGQRNQSVKAYQELEDPRVISAFHPFADSRGLSLMGRNCAQSRRSNHSRRGLNSTPLGHSAFAPGTALLAPMQSFVTAPRIGWVEWQAATALRVRYLGGLENFVPVVRHIS